MEKEKYLSGELTAILPVNGQILNMEPLEQVNGYQICPGFYMFDGATPIPEGVNFTIHSQGATACELLLYHRKAEKP